MKKKQNPTEEFYQALQFAYSHFNDGLFNGELSNVMFSISRKNNVMGYYSNKRWGDNKESFTDNEKVCDEISINPDYVGRSAIIELFQTLVHEMIHKFQHDYGNPSKRSYHNKEWAAKMIEVGLMPTSTGKIGGKITGEKMNDYPIENGKFIKLCMKLVKNKKFTIPWVDRRALSTTNEQDLTEFYSEFLPDTDTNIIESLTSSVSSAFENFSLDNDIENIEPNNTKKTKSRYNCKECNANVWGKPNLNISCLDCSKKMVEDEKINSTDVELN